MKRTREAAMTSTFPGGSETVFTYGAPLLKFGTGADQMRRFGIEADVYDGAHVEPIDHAGEHGPFDAYVAVGGGSSIDTAKAVNLLTTTRGKLLDYVNRPVGQGPAPSRPR